MVEYPILIGTVILLCIIIIAKFAIRGFKIEDHYDDFGKIILYIYIFSLIQECILLISRN